MYLIVVILAATLVSCTTAPIAQPPTITADQCRTICGFDGVNSATVENIGQSNKVVCSCHKGN